MTDQTPHSDQPEGATSEPLAAGAAASTTPDAAEPVTASVSADSPAPLAVPPVADQAPPAAPAWRSRMGLAGAAAGLLAVGGLGGFALGHATANDGRDLRPTGFHEGRGFGPGQGFGPGHGPGDLGHRHGDGRDDDGATRDGESGTQSSGTTGSDT